jgi:hypothetical protein
VFEWLIDDDNRELDEAIESVNGNMLEKLLETSPFIAVFFCESISAGISINSPKTTDNGSRIISYDELLAAAPPICLSGLM